MHAAATMPQEEALMAAYVGGNERAFKELFQLLGPRVKRFFLRKFGDEAVADDMRQITFLKMHRAREAYRVGEPVRPWLFTIAARVRIDELRKRKHVHSDDLERADLAHANEQINEAHVVERADIASHVREAVDLLPESQRVVVKMHRYQGLTFREIALQMNVTEAAVKLRAFRAYRQLRKHLAYLLEN